MLTHIILTNGVIYKLQQSMYDIDCYLPEPVNTTWYRYVTVNVYEYYSLYDY